MKGSIAMQVTLVREPVTGRNVHNAQELSEHMIQAGAFEAKFVAMRQVHTSDHCCSRSAAIQTATPAALTYSLQSQHAVGNVGNAHGRHACRRGQGHSWYRRHLKVESLAVHGSRHSCG